MSTRVPCKQCGMSPRNSVHHNTGQYGYHAWIDAEPEPPAAPLEAEGLEQVAREIVDEFCGGSEAVYEVVLHKLAALARTRQVPPEKK